MSIVSNDPNTLEVIHAPNAGAPQAIDQPPKSESRLQKILALEITPKKVKRKDLMYFSRQLGSFMVAGVPILEALDTICEEVPNKYFKKLLLEVRADLTRGFSFSDAMAHHNNAFPGFYLGMLASAELTGTLDDALFKLGDYIDRDIDSRRKLTSALLYPAIILGMSAVVVLVLTLYVLPKFKTFFTDFGAKLPLSTRILLSISGFISGHQYVVYLAVIVPIVAAMLLAGSRRGRELGQRVILHVPILGDLVRHAILERFCRVLSAMMTAGVPMPDALEVSGQATNNVVFSKGIANARDAVLRGEGFAAPMAQTGLFPAGARQMMRVGEDLGALDRQLEIAATYFDRELEYKLKRFTTMFEPAVILVVGVVVGFVAIALVSAMYGIYHQVQV